MSRRRFGLVAAAIGVFAIFCIAVRLASLRALPIFGDEAMFLRLAILLRKDPLHRLWISFQEAQPPFHVWLLALLLPISADPVYSGRLVSVAAGILSIPAGAWVYWRTVSAFGRPGDTSREQAALLSATTAALMAVSPFLVFAQRIARVDALYLLETILAAGLSIGLASGALAKSPLTPFRGVAFGILMGAMMLTRQAVSYPLWLLPPVAWVLLRSSSRPEGESGRRFGSALVLALLIAGALWGPMLMAPGGPDLQTRIFHAAPYRPAMSLSGRAELAASNVGLALRSYLAYLTPSVVILAGLGVAELVAAACWRLLGFLLIWEAILLAPAALFAANYFPRFALSGAFPLLLLAGFGLAGVWMRVRAWTRRLVLRTMAAVALAAVAIGPSLRDVWKGEHDWRLWTLLEIDRTQFITGSSGGFAAERATGFLLEAAKERPILVLTSEISGNPTDSVWLLLEPNERIRLSYAVDCLRQPILPPVAGRPGVFRLTGDLRANAAPGEMRLAPGDPAYFVVTDPLLTRAGWKSALAVLSPLNPGLVEAARFDNPPSSNGRVASSVVVMRLLAPPAFSSSAPPR